MRKHTKEKKDNNTNESNEDDCKSIQNDKKKIINFFIRDPSHNRFVLQ